MPLVFKLILVLLISLQLFGCTSTQEIKPVNNKQDQISTEPETTSTTTIIIRPRQKETQPSQSTQDDEITKAAQEYQRQRELDRRANQEWWDSVLKQQKVILEMQQKHDLEMRKTN